MNKSEKQYAAKLRATGLSPQAAYEETKAANLVGHRNAENYLSTTVRRTFRQAVRNLKKKLRTQTKEETNEPTK